jgi:hypothetical protein
MGVHVTANVHKSGTPVYVFKVRNMFFLLNLALFFLLYIKPILLLLNVF